MSTVTTVKPARMKRLGHHTCDSDWGWCGEHRSYLATYICPACKTPFSLEQCNAWPITQIACPQCLTELACELDQMRARGKLR